MADLWSEDRRRKRAAAEPLASRMRPRTLGEFVGQEHVLGPGKLLRRMLDADRLTSVVLWGPPGTGKTALAEVIAAQTGRDVERAHAALTGVGEIRRILDSGLRRLETEGRRTLLILDEIHRFARNQQDVLLADMERGVITLIGLTTQNPYFALRSALVSRSTLLRFEPLSEGEVATILRRAITDAHGLGGADVRVGDDAIAHWARLCDGDARRALNALEVAVLSQTPKPDG
ncbi:MAG: AAA family ATPase, partial [Planctomycetota bacterium]